MDYSNFRNNIFYIKQNSTLPKIKYNLIEKIRDKYDITEEMLENVAVTFSMIEKETGLYRIANVAADFIINEDVNEYPEEEKYVLSYRFKENQTKKPGIYEGEFVIDFLGHDYCGKIKFPVDSKITIIIKSSITKTSIV